MLCGSVALTVVTPVSPRFHHTEILKDEALWQIVLRSPLVGFTLTLTV